MLVYCSKLVGLIYFYFLGFGAIFDKMVITIVVALHLGFWSLQMNYAFHCVTCSRVLGRTPFWSIGFFISLMRYMLSLDRPPIMSTSFSSSLAFWKASATVLRCFQMTLQAIFWFSSCDRMKSIFKLYLHCPAEIPQLCNRNSPPLLMKEVMLTSPFCFQLMRARLAWLLVAT